MNDCEWDSMVQSLGHGPVPTFIRHVLAYVKRASSGGGYRVPKVMF